MTKDRYLVNFRISYDADVEDTVVPADLPDVMGWYLPGTWNKENVEIRSGSGIYDLTDVITPTPWVLVRGAENGLKAGILFLSDSEDENIKADFMRYKDGVLGVSAELTSDLKLRQNEEYRLRFRWVIFEGDLSTEEAVSYRNSFMYETY